jgi:diguanylate cyclase (GGDEF)-like protein
VAISTANYQVLVVDDSPVYRKLVEQALESEAYTLLFAKDGREALHLFLKHAPSMVITDVMMPDVSGLELCGRIRGDEQRAYTYIILITTASGKEDLVKGLAAGADDYLTKPFDPMELRARIGVGRRIIDLHREIDAKNALLEEMAHTDPLTGLPNRRALEGWASHQLCGAERHGFPLGVVLGDLDCFKAINDSCGHDAGYAVLREFAGVLKRHTRAADICGRMGGDEFLLVTTHVEPVALLPTVERLREQVASLEVPFGGKSLSITASFGIAGFCGKKAPEFCTLLREADRVLYAAKGAGRNTVRIESW